ncbi:MAG: VWA domain-containing protein [Caldilineaceae bacterium]
MSFIWPWMLTTLLLVPVLVWLYWRLQKARARVASALGSLGVVQNRAGVTLGWRRHLPFVCFFLALALLLVGAARPEMEVALPHVEGTVILAFDVSNSMMADDLEPTRMEAAKTAARAFVEAQPSTVAIGVVAFSNGGIIVQPPTNLQADVLATIDRLTPQGGTSLGQGVFTSLNAIAGKAIIADEKTPNGNGGDRQNGGSQNGGQDGQTQGPFNQDGELDLASVHIDYYPSGVIVLLTDGENTGPPDPMAVAQLAAEAGVRIFTVGIGSAQGAVLEIDGFKVVTQLNEPLLQDMAKLTNGTYYYAADAEALQEIYKTINLQLTMRGEKMEITPLVAGASFLVLLVGGLFSMYWLGRMP